MKQRKSIKFLALLLSTVMILGCIHTAYAAPIEIAAEESTAGQELVPAQEPLNISEATETEVSTEEESAIETTAVEITAVEERTAPMEEVTEMEPYSSTWFANGQARGLYWYSPLSATWGYLYQNETVSDILNMSEDPALEGWSFSGFFKRTIWANLTQENLLWLQQQGIEDLNDAIQLQKRNQIGRIGEALSSQNLSLFSLGDYSTTLSLSGSDVVYEFPVEGLGDHGRLWLLKLDGSYVFCGEYGKHSPSGATYKMTTATAVGVVNDAQIHSLKLIGGYQIYWLEQYNMGNISHQEFQVKYLVIQMWTWYCLNGGRSVSEMPELISRNIPNYGQAQKDALKAELEQHIAVGQSAKEVYFYKNSNSANQAMVGFSTDVLPLTPESLDVYVCLNKQASYTGEKIAGAYYGVYAEQECYTQVGSITTGTDGYGVSGAISVEDDTTLYVAEISAPTGTTLNTTVYPVEVKSYAHDAPERAAKVGDNGIVYNMPWSYQLTVTKTDDSGNKLTGITFGIYEWNGSSFSRIRSMTDNGNGFYSTGKLYYTKTNQGKFRFAEEASKTGYVNSGWSKEITIAPDYTAFLTQVYQGLLGRNPDPAGTATYLPLLQSGTIRLDELVLEITYSDEYQNKNYSDEEFIIALFRAMMGREPDAEGLNHFKNALSTGAITREGMISGFSSSAEYTEKAGLWTEQQTVINTSWQGTVELTKTDSLTQNLLSGAVFMLQEWDGSNYTDKVTLTDNGYGTYAASTLKYSEKNQGKFKIVEISAPLNYLNEGWSQEFTLTQPTQTFTYTVENTPFTALVKIVKVDALTGLAVPIAGAEFKIKDAYGEFVLQMVSGELTDTFVTDEYGIAWIPEPLVFGEYALCEVKAPAGFVLSTKELEILLYPETCTEETEEGVPVYAVEFENQPIQVDITKSDITTGEPVLGAEMELKDSAGNIIDRWTTTETPHRIYALPTGEYILSETLAPAQDGYVTAQDITFTVLETGEIQKVDMKDDFTKVEISKKDITNDKELPGAELIIQDPEGNEMDHWISTEEPHYIERLPQGEYVLIEIAAPNGYEIAANVTFTVEDTGEIQQVVMKDEPRITTVTGDIPNGKTNTTVKTGDFSNGAEFIKVAVAAVFIGLIVRMLRRRKVKMINKKETFR